MHHHEWVNYNVLRIGFELAFFSCIPKECRVSFLLKWCERFCATLMRNTFTFDSVASLFGAPLDSRFSIGPGGARRRRR